MMENEKGEIIETNIDSKTPFQTSLITSLVTVLICLAVFFFWFQKSIDENRLSLQQERQDIEAIKQSITVSREELELQIRDYINKNYGELSERDEKVDKLVIYFRQQDARLSNIEKALSNF